ncbi:unnamed protein product [Nezara viridula]|uniref:Uncharacterized protein n=1 Tax=Nezara viridula TaxID=85310 RepID=A0A9P0HF32_NEZVI|nr:unnamed protein product [Nezara viridula]
MQTVSAPDYEHTSHRKAGPEVLELLDMREDASDVPFPQGLLWDHGGISLIVTIMKLDLILHSQICIRTHPQIDGIDDCNDFLVGVVPPSAALYREIISLIWMLTISHRRRQLSKVSGNARTYRLGVATESSRRFPVSTGSADAVTSAGYGVGGGIRSGTESVPGYLWCRE